MSITSIKRDWGVDPAIVRITSTDSLAVVSGATYLADQADNIGVLQHGAFEWKDGDMVAIHHADGQDLFSYNAANGTLVAEGASFVAQYTTTGGAAAEAIAIPGVLATDLAFVQVVDDGTGDVTLLMAACTTDTLTVTFSADPVADTIINYQILR